MRNKILIVDDEKSFTDMLRLNLEATGKYEVCVENNPHKVIAVAERFRPDLILLDVIMPKKEGPDVAIDIQENRILRETPIVFLTATITKEEAETQGGLIGGRSFVAKPSSLRELLDSIEANLAAKF